MVKVRERGPRVQYDIRFRWPDGTEYRERKNAPVTGKSAALRWAQERERTLLAAGKQVAKAPTTRTTLARFWPRVLSDHYKAQRKKPSTIDAAEAIYKTHLAPALGPKPLDAITNAEIAALKGRLSGMRPKTVNNVLSVLSRILKCAVRWGVLEKVPCTFDLLKVPPNERDWYEVAEYRRLISAARGDSLIVCLLAGSAGLRLGEIRALRWSDVDLARRQITISRNLWHEKEGAPKGGRGRVVPLTPELHEALEARPRPIDGSIRVVMASIQGVRTLFAQAQRRAGLDVRGGVHMLRHTFCSHLALAGVPARAIQELAGHADLTTTQRYMHLSPANRSEAMNALGRLYDAESAPQMKRAHSQDA